MAKRSSEVVEVGRNIPTVGLDEALSQAEALFTSFREHPKECPPMLWIGPPGCGKTEGWQALAKKLELSIQTRHLSHVHPLDIGAVGLDPAKREMYFAEPPLVAEMNEKPAPRLLFLDEIDRTAPIVQSATLQLMTERKLNGFEMPDTFVVAAANAWHCQYTFELDSAMASRLLIWNIEPSVGSWLSWAASHEVDSRIMLAITSNPAILYEKELGQDAIKRADPRAWTKLSRALASGFDPHQASAFVGQVAADKFLQFAAFACEHAESIDEVLKGKLLDLEKFEGQEGKVAALGVYLCAAGRVRKEAPAAKILLNARKQLGAEKCYLVGQVISTIIPPWQLKAAQPEIVKLHTELLAAVGAA